MVYLNGVLLHGQHARPSIDGWIHQKRTEHITSSDNALQVLLHPDLALDADDILTITYLSGTLS